MRIGIDIDDTVSLSNECIIKEALKFDKEYLRNQGFKDKDAYDFKDMLYWDDDDVKRFLDYTKYTSFFLELIPIKDSIKYINMLYEDNEIIFITKRTNTSRIKNMTKKWLKKNGYKYHNIYFYVKDKIDFCIENNIDIMIDNDVEMAKKAKEVGFNYILKKDGYNYNNSGYNMIDTWEDIYNYLREM